MEAQEKTPTLFQRRKIDLIRKFLTDRDTFATTLAVLVVDRYGIEALHWTPETLKLELQTDFDVPIPQSILDKLMAACGIMTTDTFFKSLPHFIQYCNILAGDQFDPSVFNPATTAEMAWAITEGLLLYPPDEDEPFTDDIRHYIGAMLKEEGFTIPPQILQIALYDDEQPADPFADFSDDPEMYNAMFDSKKDMSTEVDQMVRENVQDLVRQISSLPLENGDTQQLTEQLRKGLRS